MTSLLLSLMIVLLVPLFVANWRASLFGLALQGALLTWIAWRLEPPHASVEDAVRFLDLFVIRGVAAPLLLYRVLQGRKTPARIDMLPPNLLAWAAALGLVLLAFRLAGALVPVAGDDQMIVGVVASAALLGLLVLASQVGVFSQIVGALRIENAIALLEISTGPHPLWLHLAQVAVLVGAVGMFRWYLTILGPSPEGAPR